MTGKLDIIYQEANMDAVVDWFVKGFSEPIESHEWFYDAAKRRLVLKLYVRQAP